MIELDGGKFKYDTFAGGSLIANGHTHTIKSMEVFGPTVYIVLTEVGKWGAGGLHDEFDRLTVATGYDHISITPFLGERSLGFYKFIEVKSPKSIRCSNGKQTFSIEFFSNRLLDTPIDIQDLDAGCFMRGPFDSQHGIDPNAPVRVVRLWGVDGGDGIIIITDISSFEIGFLHGRASYVVDGQARYSIID